MGRADVLNADAKTGRAGGKYLHGNGTGQPGVDWPGDAPARRRPRNGFRAANAFNKGIAARR